jgi:hypothetical protein
VEARQPVEQVVLVAVVMAVQMQMERPPLQIQVAAEAGPGTRLHPAQVAPVSSS